ncbi:hypothetical protein [Photobacterium andalusiense]|uniref:Uncharacterized protein n=1 Tax=Photobacterium andalusiense TaxID=2204296 RepID=A0A1Y6MF76_9GAMM|nr:hypothetical protein [Photobacterium andalusiense]SMY34569.1 hypothetical protein PAND9192_01393 [Photobacterium andalusiense]
MYLLFSHHFLGCFFAITASLTMAMAVATPIKAVIKLSPEPISQQTVDLPLNEYHALKILALTDVSSSQVPRPFDTPSNSTPSLISNYDIGIDINNNNIRDDYERRLLNQYQRPEYIAMGILAAAHWDRLATSYYQDERIPSITALTLITNNIAINQCYYALQQIDNALVSPIFDYFNTEHRLAIKQQAEDKLLDIIATSAFTVHFDPQPCQRFVLLAESMLQTTLTAD